MILGCLAIFMQRLQIRRQIVDVLRIQELSYHVRRFQLAYRLYVLFYGAVVIPLGVQVVSVLTENVYETLRVVLLILSYSKITQCRVNAILRVARFI